MMSATLIVVMSTVTVLPRVAEFKAERVDREEQFRESLMPLVNALRSAERRSDLASRMDAHQRSIDVGVMAQRGLRLETASGELVHVTASQGKTLAKPDLEVAVQFYSAAVPDQRLVLSAWRASSKYGSYVSHVWFNWALHMLATVAATMLFLVIVLRQLVLNPLERLLDAVRKMEMGYWGDPVPLMGAWEMQWLASRFQTMGTSLEATINKLMAAERKAAEYAQKHGVRERSSFEHPEFVAAEHDTQQRSEAADRSLAELARLLAMDPTEPDTRRLAEKLWRRGAIDAELDGRLDLKAEIEDAALRVIAPEAYATLDAELKSKSSDLSKTISLLADELRSALERGEIDDYKLQFRIKNTAGVWRKMCLKRLELSQVHDLIAFRLIVPSREDCYRALRVVHTAFHPLVGRFKDYIEDPKPNGYQSIHTCVSSSSHLVFEIQIRSMLMHHQAESGDAAHWKYRNKNQINH